MPYGSTNSTYNHYFNNAFAFIVLIFRTIRFCWNSIHQNDERRIVRRSEFICSMLFITLSSNFYISPHQSETHVKWHCRMGDTNVFHSLMRKSNENGKKNKINRKWNSMKYKTRIIKLNRKKKKKKRRNWRLERSLAQRK